MEKTVQDQFRSLIKEHIEAVEATLGEASREDTAAVSPDRSIGRLSRLDSMQMQQMALSARRRKEDELRNLRDALKRIDAGKFGACMLCGGDIAAERLEYQPTALNCVACMDGATGGKRRM